MFHYGIFLMIFWYLTIVPKLQKLPYVKSGIHQMQQPFFEYLTNSSESDTSVGSDQIYKLIKIRHNVWEKNHA